HRALCRYRQPRRLCQPGAHAARPRHLLRLKTIYERKRAAEPQRPRSAACPIMAALVAERSDIDMPASLCVCCDNVGFSLRYERPEEGFAYPALGAAELMLDQVGRGRDWLTGALEKPLGRGVNFQIEVASIDPIRERLEAANISLFQPVETKTYRT